MLYDLFISHASEDKDTFVRPLAEALIQKHVQVWYDEFSLELGDSIRQSIDVGLSHSRFAVIVLSSAFFQKKWTQYELDGLTEIEMGGRNKVLLPVWYGIGHDDVVRYSPSLANRHAVISNRGLDAVVAEILKIVQPQGSPLVAARNLLLEWGMTPPVVTAPYWLEVTEASNRASAFGPTLPSESVWGRWTFPLPTKEGGFKQWGERLAWTALQMQWTEEAEKLRISPLTHPQVVHEFIRQQPGLFETCETFPQLLVEYAPQLVIPGMAGEFESLFSTLYNESLKRQSAKRKRRSREGTALTIDESVPLCDEEWALRHPEFGKYSAVYIANAYFSSDIFGPPVSPYEHADHLVWLLSDASKWLPEPIHEVLLHGMASWSAWHWIKGDWKSAGALAENLENDDRDPSFHWSSPLKEDVRGQLARSIKKLYLPETIDELLQRFIDYDVPQRWIAQRKEDRRM